jgi:hypothetical protein
VFQPHYVFKDALEKDIIFDPAELDGKLMRVAVSTSYGYVTVALHEPGSDKMYIIYQGKDNFKGVRRK